MNVDRPAKLPPALIGGVFLGAGSAIPILNYLNCACCMLVVGGGMLAGFLYLRDYPSHLPRVTLGDGAVVGLLSGAVGTVVYMTLSIPFRLFSLRLGGWETQPAEIRQALDDPDIPPMVRELMEYLLVTGGLSVGVLLFSFLVSLVVFCSFAMVGGILGVAVFRKNSPPQQQPSSQVVIPPTPPAQSPAPDHPGES